MKRLLTIYFLILCQANLFAQRVPRAEEIFISGYDQKIAGNEIEYGSGISGVNNALITRADNGKGVMVWETSQVKNTATARFVTFINYIGYDSRKLGTPFNFYVNDVKKGEIKIPSKELNEWDVKFEDGSEFHFKRRFVDGNNDSFGFLYYKVPLSQLEEGKPLKLEITGSSSGELTWFMVFKQNFSESLKVLAFPSIVKKEGKNYQSLLAEITYLGAPIKAQLFIDNSLYKEVNLKTGIQSVELLYPALKKDKKITVQLKNDKIDFVSEVVIKPIKKWTVDFIQHSHTDIGYTRSQMEILAEHLRYIDYALDYCDATDEYPDSSKFRWTCEASWAVDEYLNSRPQHQIDRLRQRVKEGRIEVTGMYFNFSELPDEQTLAASLAPIKSITSKGIPVTSAMQNDVNGIGWCMNDYFNSIDVKYLNMGTHGHKALIAFDNPTAFWWISPSGKKMLAFRAEHYMLGNTVFGIHTKDFENFEGALLRYLNKMDKNGYPYDMVAIQHSGFLTDNSPPSILASDMIKKWNVKYEWPKIRTSIVNDFFEKIEKKYGDDLVEIKAHWPDWWTDGFASGAREVAASRNAHVELIAGQGGLAMAKLLGAKMPKGIENRIFETNKALLFYGEHTFGAAESISDPYSKSSMEQREIKESYAWEAHRRSSMIDEEALGVLNTYIGKEEQPSLVVYNTLNWKRDGLVTLFIDYQQIPKGSTIRLVDVNGNTYPAQAMKSLSGGSYWAVWVEKIPSFGYKKFIIEIIEEEKTPHTHGNKDAHSHSETLNLSKEGNNIQIDNDWYSISIDKSKGVITQIYDKELSKMLVDEKSEYKLGEFILENLGGREQLQNNMLLNGSRFGHLTDFSRKPLDSVWLSEIKEGAIWNTIKFKGKTSTAYDLTDAYTFEIRLFNVAKQIDFAYQLKKKPILKPESFYIAFPFELDEGKIHLEIAGGTIEAGVDQIPGSANDWNTIQNFVSVKNKKEQLILVSHEAPMMQLGNINTGRFEYNAVPESNHLFSWPMNNYWTTNFNADQRGMYTWTYNFTSIVTNDNKDATKFSWGNRVPFLARVLPKGKKEAGKKNELSILKGIPDNVLLINATPLENENAVLFHFREVSNKNTNFSPQSIKGTKAQWIEINVLGVENKKVNVLKIDALESKFFKLSW